MSEPDDHPGTKGPSELLARLNDQASELRAELERLQQALATSPEATTDIRAAQLEDANERLVRAARRAESIVATAVDNFDELARTGQHDALTDIPNRDLVRRKLDAAMVSALRHESRLAVLFLDLDDFKQINDTLGHAVGDEVVRLVARRIESVLRSADTVGRHGGDEFLVLLAEVGRPSDAGLIAAKMSNALSAPFAVGSHVLHISASIGIAIFPDDGRDATRLIQRADAAMYASKKRGPGGFAFCNEEFQGAVPVPPLVRHAPADLAPPSGPTGTAADDVAVDRRTTDRTGAVPAGRAAPGESAPRGDTRQDDFLKSLAHELRNPRAPIRTAASLLSHARGDEPSLARLGAAIEYQLHQWVRHIDYMFERSGGGPGAPPVAPAVIDLSGVLRQAADACRTMLAAKRHRLVTRLPMQPLRVHGDQARLVEVFRALLDNASAFTPEDGTITISGALSGPTVTISVADDGLGITAEALPYVFDLFMQDTYAQALRSRGLGIGLALVRELIEAHGGSIVARSGGRGQGSEFVVALPVIDYPSN